MTHGSSAYSENGIDIQARRASECFVEKYHSLARRASFCERDKVRADSQNGTPWQSRFLAWPAPLNWLLVGRTTMLFRGKEWDHACSRLDSSPGWEFSRRSST